MAYLSFNSVRIAGLAAGVPRKVINNLRGGANASFDYSAEDFVKTTGVIERHSSETLCASDLCYKAAEKLIADLQWDKSDIDALVFVSQHADYILPATACILQDRLGLNKQCYALDIALGCSGWVYGMSVLSSLVNTGAIRKALLLCGDAKHRAVFDDPLFGYAGVVTALEYQENAKPIYFDFGTDGSGFDAIITPDGGARNQFTAESLISEEVEGKMQHRLQSRMKGMDVFSFGITTAPKSIKRLAEHFGFDYNDADYVVLHQANMKMNDSIAKKLKLPAEKVPSSMAHYGNTSSASIPLTIITQLREHLTCPTKFIGCGFGVGLSWGTIAFETENIVISDIVELEETETSTYVV